MATTVVMEALSPTMEEGRLVSWKKKEGDQVRTGETLAEVETDKAVMELVSRADGVLRKILQPEGTTVPVSSPVAIIAGADEDISAVAPADRGVVAPPSAPIAPAPTPTPSPASVPAPAPVKAPGASPPPSPAATAPRGRVLASPLARRLAGEQGVDLAQVAGTGPGGRVVARDLSGIPIAGSRSPVTGQPAAAGAAQLPRSLGATEPRDVPLSQIRKTIAKRLSQSIGPVPHFFLTTEIDMEGAAEARAQLKAANEHWAVSFNDIVIKATALALTQHPACNAWWMDDRIRYHGDVHIGIAVAIEDGLITPVIRFADRKGLAAIAAEAKELAARARARKLAPEEYTGSTFSISNLGMLDIDEFTAVINPPEAGILAVGRIVEKPVVQGGVITSRRMMRVTMSCDHRVIDGATGARFLQTLKRMLENPLAMLI